MLPENDDGGGKEGQRPEDGEQTSQAQNPQRDEGDPSGDADRITRGEDAETEDRHASDGRLKEIDVPVGEHRVEHEAEEEAAESQDEQAGPSKSPG